MESLSSMMGGVLVGAVILGIYFGITELIKRKGWFSQYVTVGTANLLWIKTSNVKFVDTLAKPAWVYKIGATIGLIMCYLFMGGLALLTIFTAYVSTSSSRLPDKTTAVNNILLIPGVSDFVPLTVEVIISIILVVTLHEIAHGILSRVHGVDIKAAGAMVFIIPLGGFVEPDGEQLKNLHLMGKLQIYAAGITANAISLVGTFILTLYLISMSTGVAIIKATPLDTLEFFLRGFASLMLLPLINAVSPAPETLWITQNTILWMPTHVEPFIGYWFLLHMSFWIFWVSMCLIFTNVLPLKVTDGGQIFESTVEYFLGKINLAQHAAKTSNGVAIIILFAILWSMFVPYLNQML